MAKGFKKQLQGGGYQNLTISGAAELQNMRLQSDIQINALKEQRARQKQLDESNLTDLRRSYKSEKDNRDSIQKLEVNRQKLELENQQLLAKRDLENKQAEIKRKTAEANMWAKLSPTLGANLGKLATGLVKFNDIQSGMEQYRKLDAAGVLDNLGSAHFEMNKQATEGLQEKRNSAMLNNNIEEADYLGDIYRVSGYYGQKLIADEIKSKKDEIFNELRTDISDNDLLKNPYDTSDIYEFRGQEILKKFGIDPMSMAGLEISKVFKQEGAKQQTVAVLNSKHEIYQKKLIEDKRIFASEPNQDNFDQLVTTYMTGYTRNKNGSIVSHYGMVNPMEATEAILGDLAVSEPYATDWRKMKDLIKTLQSPVGPGNPTRKYWTGKNPAMVERVKQVWTRNFNNLKDANAALNEVEDTGAVFKIDEQNRNGDFDKEDGTAKLVAAYFSNKGNPNAQARIAKLLYVNQTENNKSTVELVMKAIRQNDVQEFVSLLDGLSETQLNNIVGAAPFMEITNDLIKAHGVDFDEDITSFATERVKDIAANSFNLQGDATDNAKRAVKATKQLYYYLFNKRYAGVTDPNERRNQVEKDIIKLADEGKGVFTHTDATENNNNVIFTQFYNGSTTNNAVNLGEGGDIDLGVFDLNGAMAQIKRKGLNLISTNDLEDVAIAIRAGKDELSLPENLKIFQRRYPQFDARKYLNQQFKESEQYYDSSLPEGKRRILFIAPSIYDAAKRAGGPFIQKKNALKYMIGTYKDGELVKGDAL
jgi:hypothetical protein